MSTAEICVRGELPEDANCLEKLTEIVFGPGMRARAAYFLREGVDHEMPLSFVAEQSGTIVGTVRLTKVDWGGTVVLMLGPLAVLPELKGRGIGRALMQQAVDAATQLSNGAGAPAIILVGDLDYYSRFGFKRISPDRISLPRPADPMRVLCCELVTGAADKLSGAVNRFQNV